MGTSNQKGTLKLSLLAITWPIFIELFLHMIMGSTDTIMLSSISDDAVAAVGVANQLIFLPSSFLILWGREPWWSCLNI